jgi:hypothetical protein
MALGEFQSEIAEGAALEVVAKLVQAGRVSSPGGALVTDGEYQGVLGAAQEAVDKTYHCVLIDQACGQIRRRGVKVALNHHLIYSVRGYVESRRAVQEDGGDSDDLAA